MKKAIAVAAAALSFVAALPAGAAIIHGFTGPYAPGTWTTNVLGNLTGAAGGSANMTTSTLTLVGGNAVSPNPPLFTPACTGAQFGLLGPCEIDVTTTHIDNPISFTWAYSSVDDAGAAGDLFGVIIDGVHTVLSDPGGAPTQTGTFSLVANSSFGWFVNCTDCIDGAATASITNFAAPEPGSLVLLSAGIVGLFARRKRIV